MTDALRSPLGLAMIVVTLVVVVLSWTRLVKWSVLATPVLLALCAEASRFDGQRHLTQKFDATFFAWGRSVELRSLAGLAVMLLAALVGARVERRLGARRGAAFGFAALGPFGMGLFASSMLLQSSVEAIVDHGTGAERFERLRAAVALSNALLEAGAVASILVCTALAFVLARRSWRERAAA